MKFASSVSYRIFLNIHNAKYHLIVLRAEILNNGGNEVPKNTVDLFR